MFLLELAIGLVVTITLVAAVVTMKWIIEKHIMWFFVAAVGILLVLSWGVGRAILELIQTF